MTQISQPVARPPSQSSLHFANTSSRHCLPEHFPSTVPLFFVCAEFKPVSLHLNASLFAMTSVLQYCQAAGTITGQVSAC